MTGCPAAAKVFGHKGERMGRNRASIGKPRDFAVSLCEDGTTVRFHAIDILIEHTAPRVSRTGVDWGPECDK